MSDEIAPLPRRRRRGLSIAVWVPALIGLTLALLLSAFTSLGLAAPNLPAGPGTRNAPPNAVMLP